MMHFKNSNNKLKNNGIKRAGMLKKAFRSCPQVIYMISHVKYIFFSEITYDVALYSKPTRFYWCLLLFLKFYSFDIKFLSSLKVQMLQLYRELETWYYVLILCLYYVNKGRILKLIFQMHHKAEVQFTVGGRTNFAAEETAYFQF